MSEVATSTPSATASSGKTTNTGGVSVGSLDGQVKWFNNHLNYGFITVVSEGEFKGFDVFVHQSNINASGYRTLRIGEYVNFQMIRNAEGSQHPFHAAEVSGIHGGKLMCEIPRPHFNNNHGGAAPPQQQAHQPQYQQHQFQRRYDNGRGGFGGRGGFRGGHGSSRRGEGYHYGGPQ